MQLVELRHSPFYCTNQSWIQCPITAIQSIHISYMLHACKSSPKPIPPHALRSWSRHFRKPKAFIVAVCNHNLSHGSILASSNTNVYFSVTRTISLRVFLGIYRMIAPLTWYQTMLTLSSTKESLCWVVRSQCYSCCKFYELFSPLVVIAEVIMRSNHLHGSLFLM